MFNAIRKWLVSILLKDELDELNAWRMTYGRHRSILSEYRDVVAVLENMHAEVYTSQSKAIILVGGVIDDRRKELMKNEYRRGFGDGRSSGLDSNLQAASYKKINKDIDRPRSDR